LSPMKITTTECFHLKLTLSESYDIAYESVDHCELLFLKITTQEGKTGWGSAAPVTPVTGESATGIMQSYRTVIEPILKGKGVFQYARIMERLKSTLPGKPSAMAMVDMALYDLMAQKAGVPLYQLLGGYRNSIPTSITIGIMPTGEALRKAKKHVREGFHILKIKGGKSLEEDISKIRMIRKAVGEKVKLRFDANQGYSQEEALAFLKGTVEAGLELVEQPTHKDELGLLKNITSKAQVNVMADESLISLNDAFVISKNKCSDLINIKLMKTGGILAATHISSVAKAAGIRSMVGCMDESALSISAGLHFALSRPNIIYADLDGHLDLLDDPFQGMVRISRGKLIPSKAPGLGWTGTLKMQEGL
jgi:L-alanine-DL-glutamate epimerase-like enolase superfamily enzyme